MKYLYKITVITFLMLFSSGLVDAQIFSKLRPETYYGNTGSSMVISAMKDAMCFLRVEYQLADSKTDRKFNLEDKNYFGYAEGVCIKISNGWIEPTILAEPWEYNSKVKAYPDYYPAVSSVTVMEPEDSTFKDIPLPLIKAMRPIKSSTFSVMDGFSDKLTSGLVVGKTGQKEEGYLVWLSKNGDKLEMSARTYTITPKDSSAVTVSGITLPGGTLGGAFVKPTFPQGGIVYFEVLGVMERGTDGWKISIIDTSDDTSEEAPAEVSTDVPKLVPADKRKKQ